MGVRYPRFVASQIIIPGVANSGGSSKKGWVIVGAMVFLSLFIGIIADGDQPTEEERISCEKEIHPSERCEEILEERRSAEILEICSGALCCSAIVTTIVALLSSKKQSRTVIMQQGYISQGQIIQPSQQVVQTRTIANPNYAGNMPINKAKQQPITQQPVSQPQQKQSTGAPSMDQIDKLAAEARNLELARDFEKAADLYQKAGLFAEAGRVRQEHLEKDKTVVKIGQIGDSVVKDSVVIGQQSKSSECNNCGAEVQSEWKFCPSCNNSL